MRFVRPTPTKTHAATGRNIPWLLEAQVQQRRSHLFIQFAPFEGQERSWTYGEFAESVASFAGGLTAVGVRCGERVVIHLGNCPEFLLAWFACAHLGAIAVTTNTRSTGQEMAYFLDHAEAVAVITQPALADVVVESGHPLRALIVTSTDLGAKPHAALPPHALCFDQLVQSAPIEPAPSDPLAPNSVQYTSGTTARPKGVVWTHANALWAAETGARMLELGKDDVTLAFLPLFHTNALSYSMLSTLWSGGTVVIAPKFSASRYFDTIARFGCTWSSSIPFMFQALASQPPPQPNKLRFFGLGAANIPAIAERFGLQTIGWFGMTETVSLVLCSSQHFPNPIGSMGMPVPGYEVRVLDDDDQPVPFGTSGWLEIKGLCGISLFHSYLQNEQATEAAFDKNGWFRTGDLVTPLARGGYRFDNRANDIVRVGGENVSAAEVERVIAGVAGVIDAAVVASPDDMLDEVPVAFVLAHGASEALAKSVLRACQDQLADFKVPREVFLVDEFPRVTLGKIDKKTLRAWLSGPRTTPPPH